MPPTLWLEVIRYFRHEYLLELPKKNGVDVSRSLSSRFVMLIEKNVSVKM